MRLCASVCGVVVGMYVLLDGLCVFACMLDRWVSIMFMRENVCVLQCMLLWSVLMLLWVMCVCFSVCSSGQF